MRSIRRPLFLLLTLCCLISAGCELTTEPAYVLQPPLNEFPPAVNLPVSLRQTNWMGSGEGSCAVASLISHVNWQNAEEKGRTIRRTYGGGQTARSLKSICSKERLPIATEENGDVEFLKWASRTRRGAVVWYFPSHAVTFCGFGTKNGDTVAVLLDNNRTKTPLAIPVNDFVKGWRSFGGFALTVLGPPVPAPFYERWFPCDLESPDSPRSLPPSHYCSVSPAPGAFCSAVPTASPIDLRFATATATGSSTVTTAIVTSTTETTQIPLTVPPTAATATMEVAPTTKGRWAKTPRSLRIDPPPRSSLDTASSASGLATSTLANRQPRAPLINRNSMRSRPVPTLACVVDKQPSAMAGTT